MRGPETHTVGGETLVFDFLDTEVAVEVFTEMGRLALPTIGSLFEGGIDLKTVADMQVEDLLGKLDFATLAAALAASVDPKTVSRIVKTLCSCVEVPGGIGRLEGQVFNGHFRGRSQDALAVAGVSFKVNGGPAFFKGAVSLGGVLKKAATTPAKPA